MPQQRQCQGASEKRCSQSRKRAVRSSVFQALIQERVHEHIGKPIFPRSASSEAAQVQELREAAMAWAREEEDEFSGAAR